jgi:hypothetical protein
MKKYQVPFRFVFDGENVVGSTATYVRSCLVNADNFCGARSRLEAANQIAELFSVAGAKLAAEHADLSSSSGDVAEWVTRMRSGPVASVTLPSSHYEAIMKVIRALDEGAGEAVFRTAPECAPRPPFARLYLQVHDDFLSANGE